MSFKSFSWLKDGLLPFCVAVATICWLFPFIVWIGNWSFFGYARPIFSPFSMAALLLASTFLTKVLLRGEWPIEKVQGTIGGLGVLAILFFIRLEYYGSYSLFDMGWLGDLFWAFSNLLESFPRQLFGLLLGAYLWRRGIALGRRSTDFDDVLSAFRNGIVMLVLGLTILSFAAVVNENIRAVQGQIVLSVLTFFFFSLLALALSKLEAVRDEARKREDRTVGLNRDWLAAVVSSILLIILLGFAVSSIFSFDLAMQVLNFLLRVVETIVTIPLYVVLFVIGYFVEYLFYFLRYLLWLIGYSPSLEQPDVPSSPADRLNPEQNSALQVPHEIIQVFEWAIIALVLSLVVYIFVKAVFRLRRQAVEGDVEEIHESLWSWPVFVEGVKAWLRSLWLRYTSRRQAAAKIAAAENVEADPQFQVSLSIRQIYRELLTFSGRLGFPRQLDETPYEYLRVLETALPLGSEDLRLITASYVQARYSGEPAGAREFGLVEQAWSRLREVLASRELERKRGKRETGE